jgi:hypothetical protein
MINKLYDAIFANLYRIGVDTVEDYIDNMAIELHDKQLDDFGILPDFLNASQILKVLKWWYKSRILRKLYLLGLNNKEIRNCETIMRLNPNQIYAQCMHNPFKLIPITIDKCEVIFGLIKKSYTPDELYRATIARKLYSNNVDKAWTGTPSKYITNEFREINKDVMSKLLEEYGVRGELYTVYLGFHHTVETTIARVFSDMIIDNRKYSSKFEVDAPDHLTSEQRSSISTVINSRFSIITGGPGSGKTETIKYICHNLDLLGIPHAVASFTGKSVARIKEVLKKQYPATIHMMIAKKNQITPFKFLIIDEASMVTTELLYYFFKTFGVDINICLVGDSNQLQPITYGNTFQEILNSGTVTPNILTKNHRTNVNGVDNDILYNIEALVEYYHKKRAGGFVENLVLKTGNNFFTLPGNIDTVFDIVKLLADKGISSNDIIIITPYNKYLDIINSGCQKIFDKSTKYVVCPRGIRWCIQDKVRVTSNTYNLGLMNGDEGTISDINEKPGGSGFPEILVTFKMGLTIKFDVAYDPDNENLEMYAGLDSYSHSNNPTLSILTLSYGCTIHSMQGSECDNVIFYIPREDKVNSSFINFNLIYTAISRSKKMCFVVGDIQTFELNCSTPPPVRIDNLGQRIKMLVDSYREPEEPRAPRAPKALEGPKV